MQVWHRVDRFPASLESGLEKLTHRATGPRIQTQITNTNTNANTNTNTYTNRNINTKLNDHLSNAGMAREAKGSTGSAANLFSLKVFFFTI